MDTVAKPWAGNKCRDAVPPGIGSLCQHRPLVDDSTVLLVYGHAAPAQMESPGRLITHPAIDSQWMAHHQSSFIDKQPAGEELAFPGQRHACAGRILHPPGDRQPHARNASLVDENTIRVNLEYAIEQRTDIHLVQSVQVRPPTISHLPARSLDDE
ncbi:hypothetical protein [Microvirgula aerodenitrificans]|uniref:hypothetical protein n=1 Tax=Microvirgula aerodenitrificans TaxID=57480 RepID=UPI00131F071C|nr:hypothetical protein [Microvirgula aerodenitrificans]